MHTSTMEIPNYAALFGSPASAAEYCASRGLTVDTAWQVGALWAAYCEGGREMRGARALLIDAYVRHFRFSDADKLRAEDEEERANIARWGAEDDHACGKCNDTGIVEEVGGEPDEYRTYECDCVRLG